MTWNHRFASLQGTSRRWLGEDEDTLYLDTTWGQREGPPLGTNDIDKHDGWTPVRPRKNPLARLGEALAAGGLSAVASP